MLSIVYSSKTLFDESTNQFIDVPEGCYRFEHSLLSITEWESKYEKPYLSTTEKTPEETLDYISMMCLDAEFDINKLKLEDITTIMNYTTTYKTATTLDVDNDNSEDGMVMTSEVIYAYMAEAKLPFDCESWNLNKLLMVLRVIGELHKPAEKMSESEVRDMYQSVNERRRAEAMAKAKNDNQ